MATPDSTIGGLPRAESINDDSLLVMEQQGEPKSVAAGTLMKYAARKVKGGQADWDAAEGESGHVLNRTHHRVVKMEPFSFNHNTIFAEGNDVYDLAPFLGETYYVYKITDTPFTKDQLDGASIKAADANFVGFGSVSFLEETSQQFSEVAGGELQIYDYGTIHESLSQDVDWGTILVVPTDLEIPGLGTVKQGTYIHSSVVDNIFKVGSWTIKNETFAPLGEEYIPPQTVHSFTFNVSGGSSGYFEVPVGGEGCGFIVSEHFLSLVKNNKPVSIGLIIRGVNSTTEAVHFTPHFFVSDSYFDDPHGSREAQIVYSCELGVLLIEFKVDGGTLAIKVDNLADKMGCITSADTVNVAEEGM